ncbi:MAG TPA: hypothetical protein VNT99_11070 [Methylomirabilota bacterium]|nr:hypothetical protein [Methylomirabilota bacterium]
MKTTATISTVLGAAVIFLSITGCGGDTKPLQAENEALRAEVAALKARADEADAARAAESKRSQSELQDVARLRGEVTQLRTTAKDAERLRAENQQLRSDNQQFRGAASAPAAPAAPAAQAPQQGIAYPREAWSFAGYTSPDAALVSAIWSMQQGNPKQYFESLTPEEQLRMTKAWEGKTPEEIAAKHQADTAAITGMKVTGRQLVSPDEVQMNVFIDGVNREEKVSMKRVGNDWKFGGYIREPTQ